MEWYEPEVQLLERKLRINPPPPHGIAFYGSSSVRLWETLHHDFPELPIYNLGFGGSTLAACVHFFERLVVPCKPGTLVFYAGDNDLGDGQPPQHVQRSFRHLKQQVRTHLGNTRFVFLSIKPSPARWALRERILRANALIQAELADWPNAQYVNLYHAMLGADGTPRPELFAADGLHLSPEGYRVWRDELRNGAYIVA